MSKIKLPPRFWWLATAFALALMVVIVAIVAVAFPNGPTATPAPPTATPTVILSPTPQAAAPAAQLMTDDNRPPQLKALTGNWRTDWSRHTIRYDEILSGGPPRDGIPSIDAPQFVLASEAAAWLQNQEPVITLLVNDVARAYPLQILIWHEIVNDEIGGVPVAVTFCPLCNAAVVFDRRHQGRTLTFGVSGLLRNSDLIMYDRETESLWQQFTGEGIVGQLAGEQLTWLPASLISFADFRQAYPQGLVLSRDTGYQRSYGRNPYVGYDDVTQSPFLYDGVPDDRLLPMARVVTVSVGDDDVAYPYAVLEQKHVIQDQVGGQDVVVFYEPGAVSALDAQSIANSKDVGATGVFDPHLAGQTLSFLWQDDHFEDEQTGSRWNILGTATDGPLAGKRLTPVLHADHFWFSWAAFKPGTRIYAE